MATELKVDVPNTASTTGLKVEIAGQKAQATEYVILEKTTLKGPDVAPNASPLWIEVSRKTATSATAAIRAHAIDKEGVFIAIPARSWRPRTVKVETKKVLHLA